MLPSISACMAAMFTFQEATHLANGLRGIICRVKSVLHVQNCHAIYSVLVNYYWLSWCTAEVHV